MKNILIISDTHKDIKNLDDIFKENKIDYLIHLGDDYEDFGKIQSKYKDIQSWYIMGNHDLEWLEPKEAVFEINGIRIYATHGHNSNVKLGLDELIEKAKLNDADIALFGHIHIQKCIVKDDVIVINPGSLSESRDKNILGSYVILQIDNNQINVICKWIEHEEILGVEINKVKLVEYNPKYKELYEIEKHNLTDLIGKYINKIEHVGSTSIPNISSKPIIDIVIAIHDIENINEIKDILVENNYIYKGALDDGVDRFHFVKGSSIKRDYHIAVTTLNSNAWNNYVQFRDYMIENPNEAKKYEALKKKLEKMYSNDRINYTKHKDEFIKSILDKI